MKIVQLREPPASWPLFKHGGQGGFRHFLSLKPQHKEAPPGVSLFIAMVKDRSSPILAG